MHIYQIYPREARCSFTSLSNVRLQPLSRRSSVKAAKGFGTPAKPANSKNGKQANQQLIDKAVKDAKSSAGKPPNWSPARPVNAGEAAKGKVDFVQVKDWGSGRPEDLGQLQVEATDASTTSRQRAPSQSPQSPLRSQPSPPPQSLFNQLAVSTQSPMVSKRMKRLPEIPPYERWRFTRSRYRQYLVNLLAVHTAVEEVTAAVARSAGSGGAVKGVASALQSLGPTLTISRAAQLRADLEAINAAMAREDRATSTPAPMASPTAAGSNTSSSSSSSSSTARADPGAASYAQYLQQLGRDWRSAEGLQEQVQVAGRLLAHAFVVHTSFTALATRVGAAAAEKLNLFGIGAVRSYQEYPEGVKDPLDELKAALDRTERGLKDLGAMESVCEWAVYEMPRALEESSLLVQAVAQE